MFVQRMNCKVQNSARNVSYCIQRAEVLQWKKLEEILKIGVKKHGILTRNQEVGFDGGSLRHISPFVDYVYNVVKLFSSLGCQIWMM